MVLACHGGVRVGPRFHACVPLEEFMGALGRALKGSSFGELTPARTRSFGELTPARPRSVRPATTPKADVLTYDRFFDRINAWLRKEHVVVSDASFALLGCQSLTIRDADGFVAQGAWLPIGYAAPAAIGVKCARPHKRAIVICGDGAFQQTCQAVGSYAALGHNTVVFVLDNGLYGIEQR